MGKQELMLRELDAVTPALRRFARALCAGVTPGIADDLVLEVLQRLGAQIRAKQLAPADAQETGRLAYGALTEAAERKQRAASHSRPSPGAPAILRGVGELPFDERAILLLVALEGLGYDAAAQSLGIAKETAVARLMRARAALGGQEMRPAHLRVVK